MTDNLDPNKAAAIIRGALGIQRKKQTVLANKLGLNRVLLNMYLNRKVNLLPEDIELIIEELGVDKGKILAGANIETDNTKLL